MAGPDTPADDARPPRLRSVLYIPGANERALVKARELPADALILDLEDAVAPGAKAEARARVCAAVASGVYGDRTAAIRVNGIGTEWHTEDVRAAAAAGPAAVVVPKVGSEADVLGIERALCSAGAPEHTRIWAMLETPAAVLGAAEIAAASGRLSVLVMGTNDLASELYAELAPGRSTLQTSLGDVPAGRPRSGQGDRRRGLQRRARSGGLRGGVPPGTAARLRRKDPHPPQPGGAVQPASSPRQPTR